MIMLLLCLIFSSMSAAEVKSVNLEENGKIKETAWQDENGQQAAGPEGYASVKYTYKTEGNTIEQYFDAEGQPYCTDGGYFGKRVQRDGRGNITEIEYLDASGQRTLNKAGYALTGIIYYGFGEPRTITYYGMNKKPVMVPSLGYASVYTEYSNKTMTRRTYRDVKGNPVDNADGYAILNQKLNKRFVVLSIRYDHADGSAATGPDGWWRCVMDRDSQGRIISIKYYDVNGSMTDRGAGYSWEGFEYKENGNVLITRYDMENNPVTDRNGIATLERVITDGYVSRECYYSKENKRITNENGVGETVYGYDQDGRLESVSYLDTEGNPVLCADGYAGYRDERNEAGFTVRRIYLGADGLPAETSGGYSETQYQYDETGNLIYEQHFNIDGNPV